MEETGAQEGGEESHQEGQDKATRVQHVWGSDLCGCPPEQICVSWWQERKVDG